MHWFSLANSFLLVVFLSAVVTVILFRTLRRDLARYEMEPITSSDIVFFFAYDLGS